MTFASPGIALAGSACALAFALALYTLRRRTAISAVRYSSLPSLLSAARPPRWPFTALLAGKVVGVWLLALAIAQPRVALPGATRSATIIVCIDTSGSMASRDVRPSRARAASAAVRAFLDALPSSDRVGILTFSGTAHITAFPTRDRDSLRAALAALPAPNGQTAIGDALTLAGTLLSSRGLRAVVLVTDGDNNTGRDPQQSKRELRAAGITLETLRIGPGTATTADVLRDRLRQIARRQRAGHSVRNISSWFTAAGAIFSVVATLVSNNLL